MVVIKEVSAKSINDSRGQKTISVTIKTDLGQFSASAPSGKSRGKHEVKIYKKSLEEDIKTLTKFKDYFSQEVIESFDDLRRIEDILDRHVGGNTVLALEYAALKALAKKKKKQVWQIINPKANSKIRFVGNCIGGGLHTETKHKKPDFQEFLLVPNAKNAKENSELLKKAKKLAEELLVKADSKFRSRKSDEDAWITSLNDKEVLEVMKILRLPIGLDIAASSFYKRKKYSYQDPMIKRTDEEQFGYLANLIKNFEVFYVEDPFAEEDFENFAKLLKKFPNSLIVGDDLTVTNHKRLEKAIKMKSINAIIIKPNQCGSLLEVQRVCELCDKHNIKKVFSHRSGETEEDILTDLAFGFEADFLKCGITGREREAKIKRLIEIEKKLK